MQGGDTQSMWLSRITTAQCREWISSRGIPDIETAAGATTWLNKAFSIPDGFSRRSWVAKRVCEGMGGPQALMVWYRDWPFASTQELSVLQAIGTEDPEAPSLVKAPGFHISLAKEAVGRGLFELGCLLGMDTLIAGSNGTCVAFASHDGVMVFATTEAMRIEQLSHELLEAGIHFLTT
jgi:hypothetical protein